MWPGSTTTTLRFPSGSSANSLGSVPSRASPFVGSARGRPRCTRERAGGRIDFRVEAPRCAGTRSSAPRSSTRRCSSIARFARSARVALRPGLPGERGLRPVDAALRFCGRSEPAEPLVEKRVHPEQASLRRSDAAAVLSAAGRDARDRACCAGARRESKPSSPGASAVAAWLRRRRRARRLLDLLAEFERAAWPRSTGA